MAREDTVWVKLKVAEIKALPEGKKAFLVELPDGEEVWFPYSQIEGGEDKVRSSYTKGQKNVVISASEWILQQKGMA